MGGRKASGLGRRHGEAALLRSTESGTVAIQRVPVTTTRFGLPRGPYGRLLAASLRLQRVAAGRWERQPVTPPTITPVSSSPP